MNTARVLMLLLSLMISRAAYAQYSEDEGGIELESGYLRYLGIGGGATYQVMNDPAISPIIYSKVGALPMITNLKINNTIYAELSMRASRINLTHNTDKLMKVKTRTQRALADYRFMLRIPSEEMRNWDIRAGGIFSAMFMHKNAPHLYDASKVYEYAVSLGLSGRIIREITLWGKTSYFTWDVSLPLIANVSRPYFLNREEIEDPENKIIGDFLSNSKTGSIGTFSRLDSRVAILYRLDNGNAVQFAYEWDYGRIKTFEKSYFAEHIVSVLFMFNY